MAKAKLEYTGDINPEHGGFFYSLADAENGYVSAVRIVPCSDAGLADNEFWIERLTVNFPESDADTAQVLTVCGQTLADLAECVKGTAKYWDMLVYACIAYGRYDQNESDAVRIGKRDEFARQCLKDSDITKRLPHNALIGNYARKIALDYCA
jgi:hypothetical protein